MGLRSAINRLKKKMKRRRSWLMASLLIAAALLSLNYANDPASDELQAVPEGDMPVSMMLDDAYFSIDAAHRLTLYQGKPGEGKPVRLYFQMDMEHLRSTMPEERIAELEAGIPVSDYEEYSSVLSTFSSYALDETQTTMDE